MLAAPNDYRFEAVETQAAGPGQTTIVVRFVRVPGNKPVDGAMIVEAKTDLGPAGKAEMLGKVTAATSDEPGLYRFSIETGMAGQWELVLTAR